MEKQWNGEYIGTGDSICATHWVKVFLKEKELKSVYGIVSDQSRDRLDPEEPDTVSIFMNFNLKEQKSIIVPWKDVKVIFVERCEIGGN